MFICIMYIYVIYYLLRYIFISIYTYISVLIFKGFST